MKLYHYGFWDGFVDKTDPTDISFFLDLFKLVFNENIMIGNLEDSDILLETVYVNDTQLFKKKWKYTFLYSGESRLNNYYSNYSCILCCKKNYNKIINCPLFILSIYCNNFMPKLIKNEPITKIPKKNIIAVITNMNGLERNIFLNQLEQKYKIDYGGRYKNNIKIINDQYFSDNFTKIISEYKFIIAMENSKEETYITEKILHGLLANIIPIYWGSDNICTYFNPERFLNLSNINNSYDIIDRITEIMNNDKLYLDIVNKPIFRNNILERTIYDIANDIKHLLFVKNNSYCLYKKPVIHFLSYGDINFKNAVIRIKEEVTNMNVFSSINIFDNQNFYDNDFKNKFSKVINQPRGSGYWIWKYYLLNKKMNEINDNEYIVYCDAGCVINPHGINRFNEYIDILDKSEYGILSFSLNYKDGTSHIEKKWTIKEIFNYFNISLDSIIANSPQYVGGILILKKNNHSKLILEEYLKILEYDQLLISDYYNNQQYYFFKDARHDQSIWSIIRKKFGSCVVETDETFFNNFGEGESLLYPFWAMRRR